MRALGHCLMPREEDLLQKATTLVLVTGWLVWSIGLGMETLSKGEVVLWGFTIYELFSFVVIYAFARLHDLEVKRLLGIEPSPREKLERMETDRREKSEFRYGDDRQEDENE